MNSFAARLPGIRAAMPEWWPILLGLAVMYVPTYYGLFNGLWNTEDQAQGPIILVLSLWLLYQAWPRMSGGIANRSAAMLGWAAFLVALVLYTIGHALKVYIFELGSFIWILAGILLIKRGFVAIKVLWFPLFFMLFMIPMPGSLIIALTMPLKMATSIAAEHILYWAGYPIARSGVILQIGQYQLLVATACAGLQTLITLEALGLFYLNVVHTTSIFRNVTMTLLIIPIAFAANLIRVMSLTLITYYYGDEAGQGFLHGFDGMVMFMSALMLIVSIDMLVQYIIKARTAKTSR